MIYDIVIIGADTTFADNPKDSGTLGRYGK